MATLILPGLDFANILSRPNTTLSASQTPSTLFPITRIADGRPSQLFIFPAIAANDYIQADINQVLNAEFETWTLSTTPDNWTAAITNDGTVTEHTGVHVVTGSGLQLDNGATGTAQVLQDITMVSGESFRLDLFARTDVGTDPAEIEIQNLETGNYLNSSGSWQSAQVNVRTQAATSLTQSTDTATVETFGVTRRHLVTLRLRLHMDAAAANTTHNYDNVLIYPAADFASIHGHNIDPSVTVELHSDDNAAFSSPADHGDFTVDSPTFYLSLSAVVHDRFWRVPQLTGTNSTPTGAIELGESVLGQATSLLRTQRNTGLEVAEEIPQTELATRVSGEQWRSKHSKFRQRVVRLSFRHTQALQTQFRDEILKRTNDGVDAMIVVIRDDRTDLCIHGRKPRGMTFTTEGGEVDGTEFTIVESPFGIVTD